MKKLLLFCSIALLCNVVSFAQGGDFQPKLPDFVPSSPTAFELGKYGDIPVNEATGMANINVPLYTYSTPNLSVPIGLSYTTSGVKVSQIASWVGLGWSLNTGGVITRSIRGAADEDHPRNIISYSTLMGWKSNGSASTRALFYNHVDNIANKVNYDYVPDLFNFSIDGLSGSFYLDANKNPVVIREEAELKIEKINSSNFLVGFTITSPKGIVYTFNITEQTKQRLSCGGGNPSPTTYKTTSWFLSKITHPLGDEITFTYGNSTNYLYNSSIEQSYGKNSAISGPQGQQLPAEVVVKCAYNNYVQGKVLTAITSNRNVGSVSFASSLTRADVNDYKLDAITIKNNQNVQVKQFAFNYAQIQSTINYTNVNFPLRGVSNEAYRLFLDDVTEKDAFGSATNGKKYSFEYNDRTNLPKRMSLSQDELGYYNGAVNTSFLPNGYGGGLNVPGGTGDRSFNYNYAIKGILTKVMYPTKGYTLIEYESGPSAIRVKKIKSLPKAGGVEKVVRYYYTTKENAVAGSGSSVPSTIGSANYLTTKPVTLEFNSTPFTFNRTEFSSNGTAPLYLTNADRFLYNTVTVGYGENFEGGGIEKKFSVTSNTTGSNMHGEYILDGVKSNTGILNGTLLEETAFKKNGSSVITQKKTTYSYLENSTTLDAYTGNIMYESSINNADGSLGVQGYDANRIQVISKWRSLGTVTTTEYLSTGTITTTKTHTYATGLAGLPSETTTTDSNGYTLKTKNYYPEDVTSISSLGHDDLTTTEYNAIQKLKTQHRVGEVVQTESYQGIPLLAATRTNYYEPFTNVVVPKTIQTLLGTNSLEDRIVFHKYDNKGNPISVSKKDGTHIAYIWGYNQTKPIAKIENFTEAQLTAIQPLVNAAVSASNADTNTSTENSLRTALNAIRNHSSLSNSQMSSFTYDPLIGVTSVTDPRGKITYYHYDSFGRLQYVKDNEGKILSKNQYNYKN
ncbi:MAG: RHS repeat protein [Flavobacteriaceae bacterium]|nr:RHS repeat protein [Flavobacteriaceae bacterium]